MTTVTEVKSAIINHNKLELIEMDFGGYWVKMNGLMLISFPDFPAASDFFRVLVNATIEGYANG